MLTKLVINPDSKTYIFDKGGVIVEPRWDYYYGAEEFNIVNRGVGTVLNDRTTVYTAPKNKSAAYYNYARCISIADELDAVAHAVAHGEMYKCSRCDEFVSSYDERYNTDGNVIYVCECGCESTWEPEPVSMAEYLQDAYDVEYRIGADGKYRSTKIMIAAGGPNIFIDTDTKRVSLYWWGDSAGADISDAAIDEIDAAFSEMWEAGRC